MDISRFTQKSLEAVQDIEKIAMEHGNQELEEEHLVLSLLKLDESLQPGEYRKLTAEEVELLSRDL